MSSRRYRHANDGPHQRTVARKTTGVSREECYVDVARESAGPPRRYSQRRKRRVDYPNQPDATGSRPQLFDWDDMGLGLEMEVSSGTTSSSDVEPEDGEPDPARNPEMPQVAESAVPQPTAEWVRSLVELRKVRLRTADDMYLTAANREWLSEQHRALDAGSMPVTLKCIVAASGISQRFNKCRDDFMRPEYRARYWSWSENFIALIDYYVAHGTINLTPKATDNYAKLKAFIDICQEKRAKGTLPTHRDQLLTALGMQWKEQKSDDSDDDDDDDSEPDSVGDETWEMPAKESRAGRHKRFNTRKRKRSQVAEESDDDDADAPPPIVRPPEERNPRGAREWAKNFVELRGYYRKGAGYDVPPHRPSLVIWMNTELARCATGTLSMVRCCILKAAKLAESTDSLEIDPYCEKWCCNYVEYVDFILEHNRSGTSLRKAHSRIFEFMYDCRQALIDCTLSPEYSAVLRAVDDGWLQSRLMEMSILRFANKRRPIKSKLSRPRVDRPLAEDALNSGTNSEEEETAVKKKRNKKSSLMCKKMVSSMIKGIVAENIEGREKTETERRAEEWVTKAGAEALNHYARHWFRSASTG